MKVGITGATGFLGSHISERLRVDHEVRGVVRTPAKGAGLGIELAKADLADVDALTAGLAGCEALVANAALAPGWKKPSAEAFLAANVRGAENQLRAARDAGVKRVIWVSTVAVYRTRPWKMLDEQAPKIDPNAPGFDWNHFTTDPGYSRSKAGAERIAWKRAREYGLALTVLRPGPIFGERDPKLTARYARMLRMPVAPAPTMRLPHVHAGDVAGAIAGALANPKSIGRAYNVTGPSISVHRFLSIWKRTSGSKTVLVPIFVPFRVQFDDSAAQRDLGFTPRDLGAAIEALAGR